LIVYLDVHQNRLAAAVLLTQLPVIEPRIDLVAVVRDSASPVGYRRSSAVEMQQILGLSDRAISAETELLTLSEFAIGSAILDCGQDGVTARAATKSELLVQQSQEPQDGPADDVSLGLTETESLQRARIENFAQSLLNRFGLP
jgi:hypothetical protein